MSENTTPEAASVAPAPAETPAEQPKRRLAPAIHYPAPGTGPGPSPTADQLEKAYSEIFGESLPADARATIYGIASHLKIRHDDGMWLIPLNFQYYLTQYQKIPWKIQEATQKTLQDAVDSTQKASFETVKQSRKEITRIVEEVAEGGKRALFTQVLLVIVGVVGAFTGFVLGNAFPRMDFVNNIFAVFYQ